MVKPSQCVAEKPTSKTQALTLTEIEMKTIALTDYLPQHFLWQVDSAVATITLNRPDKKNPLTFESYAELRDLFHALRDANDVHAVIINGAGGNFCSGGDVHEIIGPLTNMKMHELLAFTRMTGDLVKNMRSCPQPIISAIEGICAGAGAIMAMSSDLRYGALDAKVAFLFNRVGLAGCDMGACAILPRIIGQGRASQLLYSGQSMTATEGERWGFFNGISDQPLVLAQTMAQQIAAGPTFANGITKTQLQQEWNMSVDQAIESEAQAQAICMQTEDFRRAYNAFVNKARPVFEGN